MVVPLRTACHSLHLLATPEPLPDDIGASAADWPLPPAALLRRFGARPADLAALEARPHLRLLARTASVADAVASHVGARREVLTLADRHEGVVVDLGVPRLVTHRLEDTDPAIASQWVAFEVDPGEGIVSHGLETIGLPELQTVSPAPDDLPATLAALTGLAHRLLEEWPNHDPVGPATVTLRDVGYGLGDPSAGEAAGSHGVRVRLDLIAHPDGGHRLAVAFLEPATRLFA